MTRAGSPDFTVRRALFTPDQLDTALQLVEGLWSQPSTIAANGVHHLYSLVELVNDHGIARFPELSWLWTPFDPVWHVRLSRIGPGGYIREHCDAGPYRERWQVPFTVDGVLAHGDDPVCHAVGVPFRVHHHRWHSVTNQSTTPRVSLIVDRDVLLDVPTRPLRLRTQQEIPCSSAQPPQSTCPAH